MYSFYFKMTKASFESIIFETHHSERYKHNMKCLIYCIINLNLEGGALCFACNKYFAYKLVFVFKYN